MSYDLPISDVDQLDLLRSPHAQFYIKFSPFHPNEDIETVIRIERERLKSFYATNALPEKQVWSKQRITQISGCRMKVLRKFGFDCLLHNYFIFQNSQKRCTITDVDFSTINPSNVLMVAVISKINRIVKRALVHEVQH